MQNILLFKRIEPVDQDVLLAAKGDGEAFGRLIQRNKTSMYRIAKNILRNEHDVEDAISDSVLKAYKNIHKLRKQDNFKSWLIRILINTCNDRIHKRNREIATEELEIIGGSYEDKYKNFELLQAINELEEGFRIVTLLFYYEDMSLKEISKILDIPLGTVKSRLDRAKKRLEEMLKDSEEV